MVRDAISVDVVPVDILLTGRLPWPENGPVLCHSQFTVTPDDDAEKLARLGKAAIGHTLPS